MQYIATAVLTLIVGIILWQIKKDRIGLTYEVVESGSFPRERGIGQYFITLLRNTGNKPVQSTQLEITFTAGLIESTSFSDPSLIVDLTTEPTKLKGSIPILNPGETFGATITMIGDPNISSPKVVARATGVTASPKKEVTRVDHSFILLTGALTGLLIAIVSTGLIFSEKSPLGILSEKLRTRIFGLDSKLKELEEEMHRYEQGKPDREQLIFAILNRAGLGHLMPRLINSGEGITYWKTGLFLMHSFLVDQENGRKYARAMQLLLEIPDMAPSSRGSNLYLLAKVEQLRGNKEKAIEYLDKCKREAPLMYEHLITQDPSYDIDALRAWLLKNTSP